MKTNSGIFEFVAQSLDCVLDNLCMVESKHG